MTDGPVVIFDSGFGGLSVVREIRRHAPQLPLVYVADDAAFPYGDWDAAALTKHILDVARQMIDAFEPRAFVVACNTASTLVLGPLRAEHDIPFVGTVPAIKPAAEQTQSGLVSVLATPGTIERDYTRDLIADFGSKCHVRLVGSPLLAGVAENHLLGHAVDQNVIGDQIAPCFLEEDGKKTDIVVLACTHFPFLQDRMASIAPWSVTWLDPAPAIARRLGAVIDAKTTNAKTAEQVVLTSGRKLDEHVVRLFNSFGFSRTFPVP